MEHIHVILLMSQLNKSLLQWCKDLQKYVGTQHWFLCRACSITDAGLGGVQEGNKSRVSERGNSYEAKDVSGYEELESKSIYVKKRNYMEHAYNFSCFFA